MKFASTGTPTTIHPTTNHSSRRTFVIPTLERERSEAVERRNLLFWALIRTLVYDNGTFCRANLSRRFNLAHKILFMAKKTGMSDSSLWVIAIVLFVMSAWMYFKR